jgi:hypothetical protein
MAQLILAESVAPSTPSANTAAIYVKADGRAYLKDDTGTEVPLSGATNLTYTASATNGIVVSDTGTDATIPAADGTNAGLMVPAQFTKLAAITLGGNFTTSGAFNLTATIGANTNVTFPASGTLVTLAGAESLTNKKLGSLTTNGLVTTSGADGTLGVTAPGTGVLTALAANANATGGVVTVDGTATLTGKTLTAPTINSAAAFSIRNTGTGAFDMAEVHNGTLTAGRTLTWNLNDAARSISLSGNLSIANNVTFSGNFTFTGTLTATTAVTFPVSGTLAILGANTFTGTQDLNGNILKGVKNAVSSTFASPGTTGARTLDWTTGSICTQAELTGAITYTFTAPADAGQWLTIVGASDGTSSAFGITWPGTVIWFGTAFTTTVANKKWMVRLYYDGTNYLAFGASEV